MVSPVIRPGRWRVSPTCTGFWRCSSSPRHSRLVARPLVVVRRAVELRRKHRRPPRPRQRCPRATPTSITTVT